MTRVPRQRCADRRRLLPTQTYTPLASDLKKDRR